MDNGTGDWTVGFQETLDDGRMHKAETLDELAEMLGLEPNVLMPLYIQNTLGLPALSSSIVRSDAAPSSFSDEWTATLTSSLDGA